MAVRSVLEGRDLQGVHELDDQPRTRYPRAVQPYLITYRPGPAWREGAPIYAQDLEAHGHYLQGLLDAGTLLFGGPLTDSTGGIAVIAAPSLEDAEATADADPAVRSGVFDADIRRLHMVFNRYVGKGLTDPGPGI